MAEIFADISSYLKLLLTLSFIFCPALQAHILVGYSLHIQDIQLKTVNILRRTNLMILYSYNTISKDTVLQHQLTPTTLNIENIKQEET